MGTRLEANSSSVRKRIEKHRFEDEEGEEYQGSRFDGLNEYFRRKKIKLQNRDAEIRSSTSARPPVFRGVVAHVNGYTQPSLNDLHTLIVTHGGGFMQYLDGKTTVTHIIASNLTLKKKVEFQKYRIVKPAWVVDSIQAGKLLPWNAYRVVEEGVSQKVLGFENGSIVSQTNSQRIGYRDQTDSGWYTDQVKGLANQLSLQTNGEQPDVLHSEDQVPGKHDIEPGTKSEISTLKRLDEESQGARRSTQEECRAMTDVNIIGNVNKVLHPTNKQPQWTDREDFQMVTESTENGNVKRENLEVLQGSVESPFSADTENEVSAPRALSAEEHNALLLSDPKVWKSTGVNPGFLKQYYEESRLHHLSAWKADLKAQLQALAAEKSSSQKAKQKRGPGSRRYVLHVDFDSFFAAVSLRKHPQYVEKPVVVAHGGGSGSEIASCNYPARKFGIKNGMWMKHAQKLCPDLKVLPYDFKAYEAASRSFYDAVIDTGGIVQSVSVDEALVDVSAACIQAGGHDGKVVHEGSIWREQDAADKIALGLRDRVKEATGCAVSVGIGGSILLAKLALRKAKPAGQYQVKPEEVLDFVGAVTVQELPGVAYSIGGRLEEIGVKLVKDIRELTKERLISTLGPKTGEKIWDYSRGIDRSEVGEQTIRKSVSAEVNWGIRFVTQEQADEFVESLCEELQKRLVTEQVKGRQFTMKVMRRAQDAPMDPPKHLGHGKCDTFNKSIALGTSTNEKSILTREAISIMRAWGFPPGELRGIGVQMTKLEPLKESADGLQVSSQKRLQFKNFSPQTSAVLRNATEELESPPRQQDPSPYSAATFSNDTSPSGKRRSAVNTLGTQFVLPSQVDLDILAQLPHEIRSKLERSKDGNKELQGNKSLHTSRATSPALPPDVFPGSSQLDPESLNALPEEVRAEVLAFTKSRKPNAQTLLPQSPPKNRVIRLPKKTTTPTKKRSGILLEENPASRGAAAASTLTQSNSVANRDVSGEDAESDGDVSDTELVSDDFLSALPEDIRRECLDQLRRGRLVRRGEIDLVGTLLADEQLPPEQKFFDLAPRSPKPTFTSRKLSALSDLREAIRAWVGEFRDQAPYEEDIDALAIYLRKVIAEEGDMSKAVAVVKWLKWLIDEKTDGDGKGGWNHAMDQIERTVQESVQEKGLGQVAL